MSSGWTVNRGGSSTLNGKVPHDEPAPSVEAELVEEEQEAVYAAAPEPEERPDLNEPVEEKKTEIQLRSFIPVDKEDFKHGFKLLSKEEFEKYDIPKKPMLKEHAAKLVFNLSPAHLGTHVGQLLKSKPPYMRGYLIVNGNHLSPLCMYELFDKIWYTARDILPGDPRDWRRMGKTKKVKNPLYYTHRIAYWEEHAKRCRKYYDWLEAQPKPDVEIHDAEFVAPTEEPPEDWSDRISDQRAAIQLAETEDERALRRLLAIRDERLMKIVVESTLETVKQIHIKRAQILSDPDSTAEDDTNQETELPEEDEDL